MAHRVTLSEETANRFEKDMYADDEARVNFLIGTEARQQLANSRRQENTAGIIRDTAKAKLERLTEKRDILSKQIASIATVLGLSPDTGPASFAGRLTTLLTAAKITAEVANAEKALAELLKRREAAFDNLSTAARRVNIEGEEGDLPALVGKALALQDTIRRIWEK